MCLSLLFHRDIRGVVRTVNVDGRIEREYRQETV